jgi:poly(A) polymerase
MDNRTAAIEIIRTLRGQGFEAYLVGGCVRDILLKRTVNDYDIATNARPEDIFSMFRKTLRVGAQFGVAMVGMDSEWIEVATFRCDEGYSDGRHPDSVRPGTMQEDAERRDFTINGMYLDPLTNEIIDLVGGKADLENRVIRAIGDPQKRFEEDHLRMLRAVRFAGQLTDFEIENETALAIRKLAPNIVGVSAERILEELRKMLASPGRKEAIRLADNLGLLSHIVPEVYALHGQSARSFSGQNLSADAFEQTLAVVNHLPARCSFETSLAALFHLVGVGKENPLTCQSPIRTRLNSALLNPSAVLADDIARRLTCSNQERSKIVWLVQFFPLFARADSLTLAEIKRLKIYHRFTSLHKLFRARIDAGLESQEKLQKFEVLAEKINTAPFETTPLITGEDLINECGLPPSPGFVQILDEVYDAQLNETIRTRAEALDLAKHLAERTIK